MTAVVTLPDGSQDRYSMAAEVNRLVAFNCDVSAGILTIGYMAGGRFLTRMYAKGTWKSFEVNG